MPSYLPVTGTSYLRACSGCGTTLATMSAGGADVFCKRCKADTKAFDPQPNDLVALARTPRRSLVVISIDAGQVITQILGEPGQRTTYPLADLIPARGLGRR